MPSNSKYKMVIVSIIYIYVLHENDEKQKVPATPPPNRLHISSMADFSRRLFSSLGMPHDGVMSPTIATKPYRNVHDQYTRSKGCEQVNNATK
jgi:hypothetical protein